MNMFKKTASLLLVGSLCLICPIALTACEAPSSNENTAVQVDQTSYKIETNAVNNMCNGAMKMMVTGMQRRPMSIFSGANISAGNALDSTSDTTVGEASTTDIAIQVDISYTWNTSTYTQALAAAGETSPQVPTTLIECFAPGTLMYVTGTDADGNPYMSADIISPEAQEDVNALAINAQWDYDVLNSPLPETSVTKTGSFLLRVPSTVNNLSLIIVTPMGGQSVSSQDIGLGETYIYELPLT